MGAGSIHQMKFTFWILISSYTFAIMEHNGSFVSFQISCLFMDDFHFARHELFCHIGILHDEVF
ncbi:hypothetical protein D3C75_690890 [compost metagenome]